MSAPFASCSEASLAALTATLHVGEANARHAGPSARHHQGPSAPRFDRTKPGWKDTTSCGCQPSDAQACSSVLIPAYLDE